MEDKILDDDDIIDLTDLLEEGEPKGRKAKKEAEPPARIPLNEPDSFDLGKEISMEYDVSVEEIEQGGESLDIDASLSSGEEIALSPESGEGEEIVLSQEPEGEIEFDFGDAEPEKKKSKEAPHRKQLEEISVEDPGGSTFEMDDDLSAAAGSGLENSRWNARQRMPAVTPSRNSRRMPEPRSLLSFRISLQIDQRKRSEKKTARHRFQEKRRALSSRMCSEASGRRSPGCSRKW